MAGDLILITGATGFIGFAVLIDTLKAGYRARVSVRREASIHELSSRPEIAPFVSKNAVEFVVVPDITADSAFDSVLKDVVGVLHIASPLPNPTEDSERDIVLPAIHGTLSILNSSLKYPQVRRVVITSSIVAILTPEAMAYGSDVLVTPSTRRSPLPSAPYGPAPQAYRAAKALALNATDRFIEEKKPHFTIVNLLPGYVIGPNALVKKPSELQASSNGIPVNVALGQVYDAARPAVITHIDDVARIHVEALDEERVKGNQTYILEGGKDGEKVVFEEVNRVVRREFPETLERGWIKGEGKLPPAYSVYDASETRKTFGELKGYDESVKDVLAQWVELKKREQSDK